MFHLAGADALSRHELGVLIAQRDGLEATRLSTGRRADTVIPGGLDVRLDISATQGLVRTRLRGAREFLPRADVSRVLQDARNLVGIGPENGPTGVATTKPDPGPVTTAVRAPTLPERTRSHEGEVPGRALASRQ